MTRRRVLAAARVAVSASCCRCSGPAMVAGVAYLDPGNVASNASAGARYGYLLVWVVVVANAMAWLIQYLSAKLGLSTGESLPQLLGRRIRSRAGAVRVLGAGGAGRDGDRRRRGARRRDRPEPAVRAAAHRRRRHHRHRLDAAAPAAQPARLAVVRARRDRPGRDHRDRVLRRGIRRPDRRRGRRRRARAALRGLPDRCCSRHPSSAPP